MQGSELCYDDVLETLSVSSARIVDYSARTNGTRCQMQRATTHIVELGGGYDAVASGYARMNRRAIAQSRRRGVTVKQIESREEVAVFHRFYVDSCQRYDSPSLPLRFFEAVYDIMVPLDMARFYVAMHGDRPVGANLILRYGGRANDWAWGYDRELQHLRPTNAMIDQAIRDEVAAGSSEFNLGASPVEGNGNTQFKLNFGARAYSYPILTKTGFCYDAARRIKYGALFRRNGYALAKT